MTIMKLARGAALAGLGLTAMAAASSGASAQEGVFMRDTLGALGLIEPERPDIQYRERAPLVLPPSTKLPAPKASGVVANPQWPDDPDAANARRRAANSKIPETQREARRMLDDNPRLTIDEIRAGRNPNARNSARSADDRLNDSNSAWMHPDKLRSYSKPSTPADKTALTRQTLTDPPQAYLNAPTNAPIKYTMDPVVRRDEADPKAYNAERAARGY